MICRIINVGVRVIETLIILHITKTECNNCFVIHFMTETESNYCFIIDFKPKIINIARKNIVQKYCWRLNTKCN